MSREPFLIILGTFGKNKSKNVDFARVTFQFFARGGSTFRPIPDLTTVSGRSFQGLVEPTSFWAGVAETHRKNLVEVLNVSLAGGPSFFHDGPPEGECFAPPGPRAVWACVAESHRKNSLVAQAVQIVPYTA